MNTKLELLLQESVDLVLRNDVPNKCCVGLDSNFVLVTDVCNDIGTHIGKCSSRSRSSVLGWGYRVDVGRSGPALGDFPSSLQVHICLEAHIVD